jgi:RNA polymerase sigma-70 factor (sigma-E family)
MHPSVPAGSAAGRALTRAVPAAPGDEPGEAASGDLAALFLRRHAELVRLALLLVGDLATAEDVVQDVFTRLHARRYKALLGEDPLPYVRAAVVNGCRSQLRRRAIARRFAGTHGRQREEPHNSAEQEVLRSEERRQVLAALAALPARRREVLVLRYYLGLSEVEIAGVLGISTGTVKSTAARGLAALARKLGEQA